MNAITKVDAIDVNALAKELLAENGNDVQRSLSVLMERGESDDLIYRSIMRPLYRTACYELLARQVRSERSRIWAPRPAATVSATERAVSSSARMLLDFPLPGGISLRIATKDEVAKAAGFYRSQSSDMLVKYRWLDRIAKSMVGTKKVGDTFTEQKLRELQEECR